MCLLSVKPHASCLPHAGAGLRLYLVRDRTVQVDRLFGLLNEASSNVPVGC